MKKAFRDAYNRELAVLFERSAEFAAEYPGIADRLGGLVKENLDPAVAGLLEGAAFLAARVQLKLEEEFRPFTQELLNQIFPDAIAPTPSVMMVSANPPFEDGDMVNGMNFDTGAYLDARFRDSDQRVSCRFRLCEPMSIWPLRITAAEYHASPAPFIGLGEEDVAEGTKGGIELTLTRVRTAHNDDPAGPLSDLTLDQLPIHMVSDMPDAVALYEQVLCGRTRASLRYLDSRGDPVFIRLRPDQIEQVGFDDGTDLYPHDGRVFSGFATLREVFSFPRKFLGFRLTGLAPLLKRINTGEVQILLEFDRVNAPLSARFGADHLRLHCASAVNLFEEAANQVRLDEKRTEYVVTPDSSPLTHYEVHKITRVHAHYTGADTRVEVAPLYAVPRGATSPRQALYYTWRQKPRRMTEKERRFGATNRYRGTETFISLFEPDAGDHGALAERLQIRTLCSNRHLPEYLPIAESKDDFHMCDETTVSLAVVAGPTAPREQMLELETQAAHRATSGDNYWRLLSYLSLNHLALDHGNSKDSADALRELLSLFADLSDKITEAQLVGLTEVETRPIVRSIRRGDGFHTARGLEVRITMDESAFEGSGIILLGAALDRFLAEYAAINTFTQTVIVSASRGEIMTFPPRTGSGPLL